MKPAQVRMARAALNWSLHQLAEAAGVHRNTISNFETGKYAGDPATLASIRGALKSAGIEFTNGDQPGVQLRIEGRPREPVPDYGKAMTFEDCSKLRDEIAARVAAIIEKRQEEWTVDSLAIKELRSYCRKIYPRFAGRYRTVASKVAEMADAAKRALDDGDVYRLTGAAAGIDNALRLYENDQE